MLDDKLKQCAVIGAGGKMGRGIALVLLQQMALLKGEKDLVLIDANPKSFDPLKIYLQKQLAKYAEKHLANESDIEAFVEQAMTCLRFSSDLKDAKEAHFIFEAIIEDMTVKVKLLSDLNKVVHEGAYFFSNTSSIPIGYLNEKANLNNRLIGYHFYNPPAVQKLLEIIPPENVNRELYKFAYALADRLGKVVVESKDVAGFIGNGHFLREILFACKKAEEISKKEGIAFAIDLIDRVTKEYLLRPMGIFQLVDYVGIDVCANVAHIMHRFLDIPIETKLIQTMIEKKMLAGQNTDGSQKDGFFQYEKGEPVSVFDLDHERYETRSKIDAIDHLNWKDLLKDPEKKEKLKTHFDTLYTLETREALLAREFLKHSQHISEGLVQDGVAKSFDDVNKVLRYGFYHL